MSNSKVVFELALRGDIGVELSDRVANVVANSAEGFEAAPVGCIEPGRRGGDFFPEFVILAVSFEDCRRLADAAGGLRFTMAIATAFGILGEGSAGFEDCCRGSRASGHKRHHEGMRVSAASVSYYQPRLRPLELDFRAFGGATLNEADFAGLRRKS